MYLDTWGHQYSSVANDSGVISMFIHVLSLECCAILPTFESNEAACCKL